MSEPEFVAWRALDTISPIGDQRLVRQLALTASLLFNGNVTKKEDQRPMDDFDLYREPPRRLTREEEEARFQATYAAAGWVVKKGG